jgi:hypothetical protein
MSTPEEDSLYAIFGRPASMKVKRGSDFQSIDFGHGWVLWADSIQGREGDWMDNPLIDVLESHAHEVAAWVDEARSSPEGDAG